MTAERRCPTCSALATFGPPKSITIFRRFGFVAAETPVAGHGVQFGGNEGFFEADIDKARPVDRYFGNVGVLFQFAGNQRGNLTRVSAQWLGQRQRAVALKIAQVRTVGNLDDGKFGVQAVFCKMPASFWLSSFLMIGPCSFILKLVVLCDTL